MKLNEDACYAAVATHDRCSDGAFYVGVRTTGVFCRPSCPARPPNREHCEFFSTAQEALLASYRACRRCRPLSHPDEVSDVVRALLDAVEREPDRRWRNVDFDALNIHAATARRQFKARFGMTFVEYARALRLGRAFKAIRGGERVIDAQLDAGYSSSSGFRDAFSKMLGAPPASATARMLFAAWLDTPVGAVIVIGDDDAVYLVEYVDRRGLERQIERLRARLKAGIAPGRAGSIGRIEAELAAYFTGDLTRFETPLGRFGSAFQEAVWAALRAIPYGETCSYSELARAVGRPQAARAVAQANGANPFAIVVPCHRVIGSDGGLGGYGGGLHRKRWLLEHEHRVGFSMAPGTPT